VAVGYSRNGVNGEHHVFGLSVRCPFTRTPHDTIYPYLVERFE